MAYAYDPDRDLKNQRSALQRAIAELRPANALPPTMEARARARSAALAERDRCNMALNDAATLRIADAAVSAYMDSLR